MGIYNGWQFFGEVTTRSNNLLGETLEFGEFYHHIGVGYNADIRGPHRNQGTVSHGVSLWGFRAMLMNQFSVKGYSIETKDKLESTMQSLALALNKNLLKRLK